MVLRQAGEKLGMEEQQRCRVNVLLIEDSADDALLIADTLRSGGYEPCLKRVETASEMALALSDRVWDLMIADHRLPRFSALEAFEIYRQRGLDTPFIIVSGIISEEAAVSAMKAGAHDYISKSNLKRLAPAVGRELREAETRRERKKAEDALHAAHEELAAIYSNAPVALLVVDEELRIEKVNDMAAHFAGQDVPMLGLRPGEALGCSNALADPRGCGHGPPCPQCALRRATSDSLHNGARHVGIEIWLPLSIGDQIQQRCLLVSTAPLRFNDSHSKTLICAQDITEFKRMEEALREKERELQRSNADLQAYAYTVSHDLQEPLRAIACYVGLFEKSCGPNLDESSREFISVMTQGAKRMKNLIDGLLQFSRVGQDDRPMTTVDCDAVLKEVLMSLFVGIEETGAQISIGSLPQVKAWEGRLNQLFQNLIGNALKYRKLDTAPEIRISAEQHEGAWRFAVQDNGVGFDMQYAESIFGVFKRLHREEYEGAGIGLSVCKRIVERHGGRIWASSMPGDGSTFCFSLPVNP
jgi:signal transduction histidine kinase/CheY-like chemotaxis protein